MKVLTLVLAGGQGKHLGVLVAKRAKPALVFAGKYRLVDFVLSNCANSDLHDVGVLIQYRSRSLTDHLGAGKPWDLDRRWSGGLTLLPPYGRGGRPVEWYRGTADALAQNLDFVLDKAPDVVLVLAGGHAYKMDYRPLLASHLAREADVTIGGVKVPAHRASRLGVLITDPGGWLQRMGEDGHRASAAMACMGVYAFRTDVLVRALRQESGGHINTHLLPSMLARGDRLVCYPFEGYWADMDTVTAYWRASMELLRDDAPLGLQDTAWPMRTRGAERPPASIRPGASVSYSLISDGCTIEGHVEGSVLSPGVHVMRGAVVRESVILDDVTIGPQATIDRAILDKNVVVGEQVRVGVRGLRAGDARFALHAGNGIAVVGKNTRLPDGYRVTRGQMIECDLDVELLEAPRSARMRRDVAGVPVRSSAVWALPNR